MKSSWFTEIIDKTTLVLDIDFNAALERMITMQGVCREKDGNDIILEFCCDKKGRFYIFSPSRDTYRIFTVKGQMFNENGKTKFDIYTVWDKTSVFFRYLFTSIYSIFLVVDFVVRYYNGDIFSKETLIVIALYILLMVSTVYFTHKEKANKTNDIEVMKNEIFKRIDAIKYWDK